VPSSHAPERKHVNDVTILYEDARIIAVEKPTGLLTVPGRSRDKKDCLLLRLHDLYPDALLVHRLDRDTSGILVFARDSETQRQLNQLFEAREIRKTYVAIVNGSVEENQTIDLPLRRDMSISLPPTYIVDLQHGRSAITELTVRSVANGQTRVILKPHTGRSHQLRVHCQAIGHPIVGDPIYGDPTCGERLMLHAHKLSFRHPATNDIYAVESKVPF